MIQEDYCPSLINDRIENFKTAISEKELVFETQILN